MITTMTRKSSVIATYKSHDEVGTAIKLLRRSGFDANKLSIVGKDSHMYETVVGYHDTGVRMMYLGKIGAFWSGSKSSLFGSVFLMLPEIGPVLAGGPVVGWIVGASEQSDLLDSLTICGAGIYSIGVPKDNSIEYETAIRAGQFVLIAHSRAAEIQRAREIIDYTHPNSVELYRG